MIQVFSHSIFDHHAIKQRDELDARILSQFEPQAVKLSIPACHVSHTHVVTLAYTHTHRAITVVHSYSLTAPLLLSFSRATHLQGIHCGAQLLARCFQCCLQMCHLAAPNGVPALCVAICQGERICTTALPPHA
eukprot:1157239-Pelagomonas_calceolata.AAC.6